MENRLRKAGYARVSTLAEEQEESLVFQTEYYKGLIESDPSAVFAGIYADKKSGKDARRRRQFSEMVKAIRRGEIDFIYTKSIARFARNLVETLRFVREFRELGVGVYFEKEEINTLDSKSDFMLSIYSTIAEGELTSMSEQVKWAARRRFQNGSVELTAIYGYDYKDGQLTLIPTEAAIVKEIFERYAGGEGHDKIARILNGRGIKRKFSAELWEAKYIKKMLENEKYTGDALLQKKYNKDFKTVKNNGEVPQYYVENDHEPIITRELYDRVQARLAERSAAAKKTVIRLSPFSGKIRCEECGKSYLHRINNRNTPYEKWIWSCQTYIRAGRQYCGGHNIREKDFIRLFLSAYNEAAGVAPHDSAAKYISEALRDLLTQERELIALRAKGYIKREAYEGQHDELLKLIKATEADYEAETRRAGDGTELKPAAEYDDRLAAALEVAEINGYEITFKFRNGAAIKRIFNNDADRKETWVKKLGGKR